MKKMKLPHIFTIATLVVVLLFLTGTAIAELDMTLIETIWLEDSLEVQSVTPVGDYNTDGYPDLLVGVYMELPDFECYEAAYLYYGGPDFDTEPDLIFLAEEQIHNICIDLRTCFGFRACRLNDYNGDGYDDFAIGARQFCSNAELSGRVYIYFGSEETDTTADLIIDGGRYGDCFGELMQNGDFNGDDLGDIIVIGNQLYWPMAHIYLGSNPPDSNCDQSYDYFQQALVIEECYGGSDLSNDGCDEYGWKLDGSYNTHFLFMGCDTLNQQPTFAVDTTNFSFPHGDISGDGIDDLVRWFLGQGNFLCLGSDTFDIDPDYSMSGVGGQLYVYDISNFGSMFINDVSFPYHTIKFYNTGVPFDTIPVGSFDYESYHVGKDILAGDINADGINDIVFGFRDDTLGSYINIYSIIATGIDEYDEHALPDNNKIISCYPNPFNSSVVITCNNSIKLTGNISIEIYNVLGERIRSFKIDDPLDNQSRIVWDATDESGRQVSSGIYFVKASVSGKTDAVKLVYLK